MKRLLFLLLGIAIIATSCQPNTELTDSDKDAIVQAVKQVSQEWYTEMSANLDNESINRWMKYQDENFAEIWQTEPVLGAMGIDFIKSNDDFENTFNSIVNTRISTTFSVLESHYSVLSSDKVLEVIRCEYFVTRKDSTTSPMFIGINSVMWGKVNGEWKVQYIHQSWARKPE